jgi:hypothetical protein
MEVEDVRVRHHIGHAGSPAAGGQHVLERHYRRPRARRPRLQECPIMLEKKTNQLLLLQVYIFLSAVELNLRLATHVQILLLFTSY